ncbi:MAG: ASKHA domain-containing protein [Desulfobacteraceae bacterium]|nr:ASKHA domain-containing protein [Desulfobacteraceae bacterium]MCF8094621.1 ASKHA domain-containing protein [Desulfobacteraceae bacterium]
MTQYKVSFLPHEKEITVDEGQSLIRAAMDAGVHINASCGGEGVCGKCRVLIESGEVDEGISEQLSKEDIENGYRLACLSKVKSDLTVRIPTESFIDAKVLNLQGTPRKTARIKQLNLEDLKEKGLFVPPVEKLYVEMPAPDSMDNEADVTRLVGALQRDHGEHRLEFDLSVLRKVPDVIREADYKVTVNIARPVREDGRNRVINIQSGDTTDRNFAIAVDIGTTTIYGQVIDLISGEVLAQYGDFNSQISYGEDIISRIVHAEKQGGLEKLHSLAISTINSVIAKIIKNSGVDKDEISTITFSGNTTMTQLFLSVNPRYIRRSPYVPAANIYPPFKAVEIGLDLPNHVTALVYPQVSSYVGGDIVAGVMGSGMYQDEEVTLYMDIGTNAEVVIGNKDWLVCAACSAGPAFEGGGIKFGMRAAEGAIEDFSIDPVALEPMNVTIGNVRPKGICGSGLITTVAVMFEMGIIDNRGKFNRDLDTPRLREVDGVYEFVLAWKDVAGADRDVVLSEIDIDNLIRAKGAIYSGCMTLLSEVGLSVHDLDRIIMAGGFGSYIDLEKTMTIGLLPEIDAEKVTFIGNGSLMGARMSALTNSIRRDVVATVKKMTNFELSETKSFMDNYVAALFLPHTEQNLFPALKARLEDRQRQMEQ